MSASHEQHLTTPTFRSRVEQAVIILSLCVFWVFMQVMKLAGRTL